jgi:hypothetical protein
LLQGVLSVFGGKMKIFISSTIYELMDLRAGLFDYLSSVGYEVVMSEIGDSGFEISGNMSSIECCLSNVRSCDALVLIADRRYGPTLEKFGYGERSATHLEYDEAINNNIPVYVFLRDRTDADLSAYKMAAKKRSSWQGGEWVSKKEEGLLKMLYSHSQLRQRDNQNWLSVFRSSVDLKRTVANQLRIPRYNHDLPRLIATGDIPILNVSSTCEHINHAMTPTMKFTAKITNTGRAGVFVKRLG